MTKRTTQFSYLLFFLFLFSVPAQGQEFEDLVSRYTSENGKGYMQPLADAFGATLNSGLYHSAKIPAFGINVELSIETTTAIITDEQKTFTATTEGLFEPVQTAEVPTIFGDVEPLEVPGTGGTAYVFPGGFGVKRLPVAVPQLTVGSFMGTQAMLRYMQFDLGDDFGSLKVLGYGVRHSISQYIPLFPVDIAATFFRQKFELGDIVEANATYFGIQSSLQRSIFEFYAGYGYGKSNLDLRYEFEGTDGSEEISFELDSEGSNRLTFGFGVNLLLFNLHTDFTLGQSNVLGLGVGFKL
ncbi:MAG: hypothetical protein DWQ05_07000 [Calditrichaeota bacterium]|nr:MAG: hypothetical protein DWQ05_07000 [Calditrichota bacterium]